MGNRSRADVRRSIHKRIRKKISGTTDRPRLAVYRSTNHIYAQVIDDVSGKTLVSASSVEKDFRGGPGGNVKAAEAIGKAIAERAIGAGISEVVFDRGGYIYHGRVKALLDATRSAGLNKSEGNDKPRNGKKGSKPDSGADVAAEKPEKKAKDEKPKQPKTEKPKKAADAKEADAGDAKKPAKADGAKKKAPKKNEKPEEVVSTVEDEGTNE